MKKKILLLLLIPVLILATTACGATHEGKQTDKKLTKTIELSDTNLGFTTTFTYDAEQKFIDVEEQTGGASNAITFKNEELDVGFEMYYNKMRTASYNDTQKSRSNKKYYKEYKFGDYEAYAYGDYTSSIQLNVLLGIDEDDMAEVLFVSIDRLDIDEDIVVADVLEKDLKEFFDSMEFVKE